MIKLCAHEELKLTDILGNLTDEPFSTTKTGKQCIDYILTSPELISAVKNKGYLAFDKLIYTDHQGMFVDFDTTILFGDEH
eukprot:6874527-Ditylum_brightwellii.AAC.1